MSGAWGLIYGFQIGAPVPLPAQAGRFFPYGFPYGAFSGIVPPVEPLDANKQRIIQGTLKRVRRRRSEHEKLSQLIDVMLGGEVLRGIETEPPPLVHVAYTVPKELHDGARIAQMRSAEGELLRTRIYQLAAQITAQEEDDIEMLLLLGS